MFSRRHSVAVFATLVVLTVGSSLAYNGAAIASPAQAATIPYSGRLTDPNGQPVADGAYDLRFELYDAETSGRLTWSETQFKVSVKTGNVNAVLGSLTALPKMDAGNSARWLVVSVRGPGETEFTLLTPRQQMTSNGVLSPSALACPHSHYGDAWSGSTATDGLFVSNSSTLYDGIHAESYNTDANHGAIYARNWASTGYGDAINAYSNLGVGVRAASGSGDGLEATTASTSMSAIFAHATDANGVWATSTNKQAVHGGSTNSYGVYGDSTSSYGVYGVSSSSFGVVASGKDDSYADQVGDLLLAGNRGEIFATGAAMDLYSNGDVFVDLDNDNNGSNVFRIFNGTDAIVYTVDESGNTTAAGTKSAQVQTAHYGQRLLYSVESSEVWFEDIGKATLVDGAATVRFDPIFAESVNLKTDYHVFVTPSCQEPAVLYVTQKNESGFTVKGVTLKEQPSNCAFDFQVIAKRLGYESTRMAPAPDSASSVKGK